MTRARNGPIAPSPPPAPSGESGDALLVALLAALADDPAGVPQAAADAVAALPGVVRCRVVAEAPGTPARTVAAAPPGPDMANGVATGAGETAFPVADAQGRRRGAVVLAGAAGNPPGEQAVAAARGVAALLARMPDLLGPPGEEPAPPAAGDERPARSALLDAERRYRALVEQVPAIVATGSVERDGRSLYISPQIERMLGYRPDDLLGRRDFLTGLVHPDDLERVAAETDRTDEIGPPGGEGDHYAVEYRARAADGRWVWLQNNAMLVRDPDGTPRYWQTVIVDITATKRAEAERAEAELRYRELVEQVPGAVALLPLAMDEEPLYVSPQVERITGYRPDELTGVGREFLLPLVHPFDRARALTAAHETDATEEAFDVEYQIRTKDGRWVWVRTESILQRAPDGTPRHWQSLMTDVTARRRAEDARLAAEQQYRALVDQVPAIVFLTGYEEGRDRLTFVSPRVEQVLGYTPEEVLAQPGFLHAITHPDYRAALGDELAADTEHRPTSGTDCLVRAKDGRWVSLRLNVRLLRDSSGTPIQRLGVAVDVTELEEAVEVLREEELRHRLLVEAVPAVLYTLGPERDDAEFEYVSPQVEHLLGYTPAEMGGPLSTFVARLHPDDVAAYLAADDLSVRTGRLFDVTVRVRAKDGRWVWVRDRSRLLRDEDGTPLMWQGLMTDVGATANADPALQDAERRYQALVEQVPAIVATASVDPAGGSYYVSPQITAMLGYQPEEVIGERDFLFNRIHPDDRERVLAEIARTDEIGPPGGERDRFSAEFRVQAADGAWRWVRNDAALVRDPDGTPRYWQTVIVDTTEAKAAEQALLEAQGQYRDLVEQIPGAVGLVPLDPDEPPIYISPQIERITGYRPDELLASGRDVLLPLVHPYDRERFLQRALATDETGETFEIECQIRTKDQRWVWVRVESSLLRHPDGSPRCWQSLVTDITERRRDEEARVAAEQRYRLLIDQVSAIVFVSSATPGDDTLSFVSPKVEEILGYTPEEMVGRRGFMAAIAHPDDADPASADGRRDGGATSADRRVRAKDGRWVWLRVDERLIHDQSGKPLHRLGVAVDVTATHEATEALLEAERRYRTLVEEVPGIVYTASGEGTERRFTFLSPQVEQILGFSPEEVYDAPSFLVSRMHPDDVGPFREATAVALEHGTPLRHAVRVRAKDERWVWLALNSRPITGGPAATAPWQGLMLDISAEKAAEEAAQAAERTYRSLVEQMPAAVYTISAEVGADQMSFVSPQIAQILGYAPEEVCAERRFLSSRVHPDDQAAFRRAFDQADETGEPFRVACRVRARDGRWVWTQFDARLVRDEAGTPLFWQGMIQDISAEKAAEAALQDAEGRYRTLVERAPALIYTIGPDVSSPFTFVNPQVTSLLGYTPEEVTADADFLVRHLHPDDFERVRALDAHSAETRAPFRAEYRLRATDGRWVWLRVAADPIADDDPNWLGIALDVTAEKAAEAALRETETRYRELVEQVPGVVALLPLAADQPPLYVSPQIERLTGYRPDELTSGGRDFLLPLTHPDDRERLLQPLQPVDAAGDSYVTEFRVRDKDGAWRWVRVESSRLRQADGTPRCWQALIIDITERRQAEQEARDAELRWRDLVEQSPAAVYSMGPDPGDTSLDYVSPRIEQILGYPVDQFISHGFIVPLIHPDDRQAFIEANDLAERVGGPFRATFRVRAADGRWVWLQVQSRLLRDEQGTPLLWQGLILDVSAEREAEEAARAAERRYRELVDRVPAAIYTLGAGEDVSFTFVSPQVERLLGYTAEEVMAEESFIHDHLHPDDRERVLALDARSEATGEPLRAEYRLRAKDGRWVWLRVESELIRDEDGTPRYWQGILTDITALQEAAAARLAAEQERQLFAERVPAVLFRQEGDVASGVTYISQGVRAILGWDPEAVVRDPDFVRHRIHPDDLERVVAHDTEANRTRAPFLDEYRVRAADGRWVWVRVQSTFIDDESPHWLGVVVDVTAEKAAEAALQDAERRYRTLVDQLPAIVFRHRHRRQNPQSGYTYISPGVTDLLGYTPEEILADPSFRWDVHPDDRERVRRHDLETDRTLEPFRFDFRVRAKDGRWVWLRFAGDYTDDPEPSWLGVAIDVTAEKAAQQASATAMQRYRTLVEHLPDIVMQSRSAEDPGLAYVSPQVERILGWTPEEVLAEPNFFFAEERIHPDDRAEALRRTQEAVTAGQPIHTEMRLRSRTGEWRWIRADVALARDDEGSHWQGVLTDVTAQKAAETALQAAERRYRTLVDQLPAIVYRRRHRRPGFTYISPGVTDLLGYTPEEILADPDFRWDVHPDDRERVRRHDLETDRTLEPFRFDFRVRAKDGRWVWLRFASDYTDDPEPSWLGVAIDVTAEKAAQQASATAMQRYRTLVEHLPDIVMQSRSAEDPGLAYVSPQVERILGWTPEEVLAEPNFFFAEERIHPDDRAEALRRTQEAVTAGQPIHTEMRLRSRTGEWRWIRADVALARDDEGSHWQGVLTDVTAQKAAETALQAAERRYRTLVDQLPAIVYRRRHRRPGFTYISPGVTDLLGYTPEEILADPDFRWQAHPDDEPRMRQHDLETDLTLGPFRLDFRVRAKDGRWVWLRFAGDYLEDPEPSWLGVAIDVTAEKAAEEARLAAERERSLLVEQVPAVVYRWRGPYPGTFSYLSPQLSPILGWDPEQAKADPEFLRRIVHPDDVAPLLDLDRVAGETRSQLRAEFRARTADGRWVWLRVISNPVPGRDGLWQGLWLDVTAEKAAETALRASEERYRLLTERETELVTLMLPDGEILYVSPSVERYVEAAVPEADLGVFDGSSFHPDDREAAMAAFRASTPGQSAQVRLRLVMPGGGYAWHEALYEGLTLPDGRAAVRETIRNVHAQVLAEAAVTGERDLLQTVIDTIPDLISVKDRDGRLVRVNRALTTFFGFADPADLIGKDDRDFFSPEEAAAYREEEERIIRSGTPMLGVERSLAPASDRRLVESKLPLRDPATGEVVGLVCVSRDVTDLRSAIDALEAERQLLQAVMDLVPDPIYVRDPEGRFLRANPAAARLFGADSAEAVIGTRDEDWSPGVQHLERVRATDAQVFSSGRLLENERFRVRTADGGERVLLVSKAPFQLPGKAASGVVGIAHDVTALEEARLDLERALATERALNLDLEQLARAKSQFIATLSHEFRTPLTSIQGFSELLGIADLEQSEAAEFAGEIHRSAVRLARLVNDILDLDRLQARGIMVNPVPDDLNAVVREAVDAFRGSAPNHRFDLDLADLPPIPLDRDRMLQVLTNLIGNAVKYSPAGGPVRVTTRRHGEGVRLTVSDQGVGIPAESMRTIFEPYIRVPGQGRSRVTGTGLGLAITRAIVEGHGGEIRAESVEGHGATLIVDLPAPS